MNTKLIYVFTTSDEDTYFESALISIFSAKQCMPNSRICLLVDDKTDLALEKMGKQLQIDGKGGGRGWGGGVHNMNTLTDKQFRSTTTFMHTHYNGQFVYYVTCTHTHGMNE